MKNMKGKFRPQNPKKYSGNPTNIVYRSKWELDMMLYFDKNIDIIEWGSEEIVIPYISPLDNKMHRYFPDFIIKTKSKQIIIIEVKPFNQTRAPAVSAKKTNSFISEVTTWVVNEAKWKAALQYCKDRGYTFQILTEKEIYGK